MTLLGDGHACVPAAVLRLTATPRPGPSVAAGVGPQRLRPDPVIAARSVAHPLSGLLARKAARGEQLQQQRRI